MNTPETSRCSFTSKESFIGKFSLTAALLFLGLTSPLAADQPTIKRLSADTLAGSVFDRPDVDMLTEESEAGEVPARDLVWHESADACLQTGVYETGENRYTIDEPYPYDELMIFIDGGVTLTPTEGEALVVVAGDTVMMPRGWTGIWDSAGYRKIYVIYNCPD